MANSAKKSSKQSGLGRGLAAILEDASANNIDSGFLPELEIGKISPNPNQPRSHIDAEDLIGLADSIREHGIIEPLIVTKIGDNQYRLVAGERRFKAAQLAQLSSVPAIVKEVSPQEVLEIALIENIQRKDLNPLEEALALSELYSNHGVKLEDIARKIGRDISTISNKMRLLKLPKEVQQGVLDNKISESHAYILLSLKSKDALLAAYNIIVRKALSVRNSEDLVRKIGLANEHAAVKSKKQNAVIYDEKTDEMQEVLSKKLGKGFRLIRKKNGGRITIPFSSDEQLEALYEFLVSTKL